jgi:PAS domain S-box-containing protein
MHQVHPAMPNLSTQAYLSAQLPDDQTDTRIFSGEVLDALDEHAIVSITDATGRIVHVNDMFCRVSGYSRFELVGSTHRVVKSGEHPPEFYEEIWETICSGRVWHGVIKNRRKNGDTYWVSSTIFPVLDEQGLPQRYISIRTDISRQKQLEEKVRAQSAFLTHITEALGEGILVEDVEGRCIFASDEALRLLQRDRDELLGWSLRNLVIASLNFVDAGKNASSMPDKTPAGWSPGRYDGVFIRGDGRRFSVAVNVQAFGDQSHPGGTVVVFHDNSKEKRRQTNLRRAADAADRANRAKTAFLANLSHEIRTPLGGILGLTHLALEDAGVSTRLGEYLKRIENSATALANLVSNVLDISKIEAGKLSLERIDFDLHELLRSIWDGYHEPARLKGLDLVLDIDPGVPVCVNGDPMRLRQILVNYIANALKFTTRGSIKVSARRAGKGRYRFEVADTGIGIEKSALSHLFDKFTQAEASTTRRYGGTGLGLSICRELAQQMGGSTGASSTPNVGSVFWAEFPMTPALTAGPAPVAIPEDLVDLSDVHVLLVEDNEVNIIIAQSFMEKWHVRVTTARDGREALEALFESKSKIDLVLMDVHMPVMDGRETTLRIREQISADALPIIALTAAALATEKQECLSLGMNDFLTKPFNPSTLRAAIARWSGRQIKPQSTH